MASRERCEINFLKDSNVYKRGLYSAGKSVKVRYRTKRSLKIA